MPADASSSSSVPPSTSAPSRTTSRQTGTQTGALTSTTSSLGGSTAFLTTTFTSSSQRCVATLEASVLENGSTVVLVSNGTFATLNNTCHSLTAFTTTSSELPSSASESVAVSSSPESRPHSSATSPGMIAGLAVGVVALLACLVGAGFWLWYRRRRSTSVFTMKAKMLEEDRSGEVPIRWEKDSAEVKESDSTEIKEMSAGPLPVEIGDARSIQEPETTPLSPISIDTRDGRDTLYSETADDIVSPLSPLSPKVDR